MYLRYKWFVRFSMLKINTWKESGHISNSWFIQSSLLAKDNLLLVLCRCVCSIKMFKLHIGKKSYSSFWWDALQLLIKCSTVTLQLSLKSMSTYEKKAETYFPSEITISILPNSNLWLFQSSLLAFNTDYIDKTM